MLAPWSGAITRVTVAAGAGGQEDLSPGRRQDRTAWVRRFGAGPPRSPAPVA
jgi:hypothetical protein